MALPRLDVLRFFMGFSPAGRRRSAVAAKPYVGKRSYGNLAAAGPDPRLSDHNLVKRWPYALYSAAKR
jgi:hypothetical protein